MGITDVKTCAVGNPREKWLFVRVETDEGVHSLEVVEAYPYHTGYGQWLLDYHWQFRRTPEVAREECHRADGFSGAIIYADETQPV
jgi:hypothetical protein